MPKELPPTTTTTTSRSVRISVIFVVMTAAVTALLGVGAIIGRMIRT